MTKEKTLPTLLFLHGALGVSQDLEPLMQFFREKHYPVVSFDFSGHGKSSPWPKDFRIDLFSEDLENYLSQHTFKDLVVFGYSMGGYVALYHQANRENSPIKQIFTYGTKFNWSEKAVARELPMLDPIHLEEKFPQFADILKEKHGERWKALLRSTAHMMQHLEKLDGLTREDLSGIHIPVVMILGEQDRMVTSEETHFTSKWLKRGEVKILAHSKHELERSNLKEISHLVLESMGQSLT